MSSASEHWTRCDADWTRVRILMGPVITDHWTEAQPYVAELPRHMPMFNNLLNLELRQRSINLGSIALLKILQESPNLKTLEFSEVTSPALP